VVSKRRDLPYRSGRSIDRLKVRCSREEEFVIAGYLPATHDSNAVGTLILGRWQASRLIRAGKTGGGFTVTASRNLARRLDAIRRHTPPFADPLPRAVPYGHWKTTTVVAGLRQDGLVAPLFSMAP
jgi:bifunctional non-homologous end joining protein LigD